MEALGTLLVLPLYRFMQTGFVIDLVGSFIIALGSLYLYFRISNNKKAQALESKIHNRWGTIALIVLAVWFIAALLLG